MYNSMQNDYLASRVLTADPLALVSYLFEGLVDSVRGARVALHQGDILGRSRAITKGVTILGELAVALNGEAETTLTTQLRRLYEYMIFRLTEANVQQIEAPLEEVERLAAGLAEAWKELGQGMPSMPPSGRESGAQMEHFSVLG